jgi:hypothetical protein
MAKRNSTVQPTPAPVPEDAATALLVQLHACRKLLELARTSAGVVLHRHGMTYSNKVWRAFDDIHAAEHGITEATKTVERLITSPGRASDVLRMAGLTSNSNAV